MLEGIIQMLFSLSTLLYDKFVEIFKNYQSKNKQFYKKNFLQYILFYFITIFLFSFKYFSNDILLSSFDLLHLITIVKSPSIRFIYMLCGK
jgi:hypothetical protein